MAPLILRDRVRLGGVAISQIVVVQLAVVATLAASSLGPKWMRPVVIAAAGVAVAFVLLRSGGRWWYQRVAMSSRMGRRQPNLLATLRVTTVADQYQNPVAVAEDEAGWFAVLSVDIFTREEAGLPVDRLVKAAFSTSVSGLQLVTHTVPAPASTVDVNAPAAASYRLLLGQDAVAAQSSTWLVIRIDTQPAHDDFEQVRRDLAGAAARMVRTLKNFGVTARALNEQGLRAALWQSLCGVANPREKWGAWENGGLAHACYWVRGWPDDPRRHREVFAALASAHAMTSVAVTLRPAPDGVDIRALLRLVAHPEVLPRIAAELGSRVAKAGAKLYRLDGEHGPATYATAPTAGAQL